MTVHLPVLQRARTIMVERLPKRELLKGREEAAATLAELGAIDRPRTRADCVGGERPCPFVSCRHHLYLDVSPDTGSIKLNFPGVDEGDLERMPASCALDVVDARGAVTLNEVGVLMNLTRERVRQLEESITERIKSDGNLAEWQDHASPCADHPLARGEGGDVRKEEDAILDQPIGEVWAIERLDDETATNIAQDRTWRAYESRSR